MFSWICPKCGAEVPPAYNDCPNCQPVAAAPPPLAPPTVRAPQPAPPPPATAAPHLPRYAPSAPVPTAPTPTAPFAMPPPAPVAAPQPVVAAAAQQQPQQQVQYVYANKPGAPAWLVTLGVFAALVGAGYAFYTLVLNKNGASAATPGAIQTQSAAPEEPAATGPAGRVTAKLARHLEVTGIRIIEENKRSQIRMMVVNHSGADMAALKGSVTLTAEGKPGEVAVVPFTLASLGSYEAKEITAPLKTTLRAYELPDWQFLRAQVKLTGGE